MTSYLVSYNDNVLKITVVNRLNDISDIKTQYNDREICNCLKYEKSSFKYYQTAKKYEVRFVCRYINNQINISTTEHKKYENKSLSSYYFFFISLI